MPEITSRLSTALADRYQIERHLGEGGMATVYLAQDLKHDRQVALKVLKPELAAVIGAERFVQEIKTTAALQHPHILPLFDSGEADGFLYYVMPFIDGVTLRDKLDHETQLGIDEAVRIATEVADALDYAHRHDVIHRDIKPENILLHDGRPMVADFGIALALSAAAGGRMTETGMSLGTPHYMSPEQATAEKDLTNRSDIYSLGTVLFEMLTGEPPHIGGSAQAIVMKIVTDEARPVTELRKSVPPHVAGATAKSLEKLPADRFETAAKFAEALHDHSFMPVTTTATRIETAAATGVDLVKVGLAAALVVMTAVVLWLLTRGEPPRSVTRFAVAVPDEQPFVSPGVVYSRLAVAPDGSGWAYVGLGNQPGVRSLWARPEGQLLANAVPGSEGAANPFYSPDGRRIGFMTTSPRELKVASLSGGPAITLEVSAFGGQGASWGGDGFIYLDKQGSGGIVRVPENGGDLEVVSTLAGEEVQHWWPHTLPNGKGVLVTIFSGGNTGQYAIGVVDLATGHHRVLTQGIRAFFADGQLIYITARGTLMAAPFDEDALAVTGDPVALLEGVRVNGAVGATDFGISTTGTLTYMTGVAGTFNVLSPFWIDRTGQATLADSGWAFATVAPGGFSVSPDGAWAAFNTVDSASSLGHIYLKRLPTGIPRALTFEGTSNRRPTWSPDQRDLLFISDRTGGDAVWSKPVDGSAPATMVLEQDREIFEALWTPDGEWLVFRTDDEAAIGNGDILAIRPGIDTVPVTIAATEFEETSPTMSADGSWIAYASDRSGRKEVYVRRFLDSTDAVWQVSGGAGGVEPLWSRGGSEIFYRRGDGSMMVATVSTDPTFEVVAREFLFDAGGSAANVDNRMYATDVGDDRFLMLRPTSNDGSALSEQLIVVNNWFTELRERVGND